jgi:hypothetical protein
VERNLALRGENRFAANAENLQQIPVLVAVGCRPPCTRPDRTIGLSPAPSPLFSLFFAARYQQSLPHPASDPIAHCYQSVTFDRDDFVIVKYAMT